MVAEATRVLVVEDVVAVAALIRHALESEGMAVDHVRDLAGARDRLTADPPDVMVLDLELPDGSGLGLLEHGETSSVPVVILSSRQEEVDRVVGLELGAEDYVIKPFFPRELAARVRRAATRTPAPSRLTVGDLVIDLASRDVSLGGASLSLTGREFDLLVHMASSPRVVFSREDLLRDVWNSSSEWQSASTVTEHVRRLRLKIETDPSQPRRIVTVGRAGYRLEPGAQSP